MATTQLYSNRLGLAYNEKLSRFMNDTATGSADSVLAIYNKNVLPNSEVLKTNALIHLGRYAEAQTLLNAIASKGALYADYVSLQREFIAINESAAYLASIKTDAAKQAQIQEMANTPNALSEGLATTFLEQVYGIRKLDEEKPEPETPSGSRMINNNWVNEAQGIHLNENIVVYPNPAQDVLNIAIEGADENTAITILDVNGKVLISQTLNTSKQIKTDALSNGVYFIQLMQNNKTMAIKKVVIIK